MRQYQTYSGPSLPVILYAIVANVPPDSLYLAGLIPGTLLVVIVALYGIQVGRKVQSKLQPFSMREALSAGWAARWELSVPIIVVVLFATVFGSTQALLRALYARIVPLGRAGDLGSRDEPRPKSGSA